MGRMSLSDIVQATGVNYVEEYKTLCGLFYSPVVGVSRSVEEAYANFDEKHCSVENWCDEEYMRFPAELIGTTRSISGFCIYHNIDFIHQSELNIGLDELLALDEYVMTFVAALLRALDKRITYFRQSVIAEISAHIKKLNSRLNYKCVRDGSFFKLVPMDVLTAEAISHLPKEISIKTFLYRHRSIAGKLEEKKSVLKMLGEQLEPTRRNIKPTNLEDAIFSILNNMNIRHNNVDPSGANYHPFVADMSDADRESWYDKLYDMMLAAFAGLNASDALADYEKHKKDIGACKK